VVPDEDNYTKKQVAPVSTVRDVILKRSDTLSPSCPLMLRSTADGAELAHHVQVNKGSLQVRNSIARLRVPAVITPPLDRFGPTPVNLSTTNLALYPNATGVHQSNQACHPDYRAT